MLTCHRGPLKSRDDLMAVLLYLKMSPTADQVPRLLGAGRTTTIEKVTECIRFLHDTMHEISWDDRLSEINHCTHYPYYVTFFLDTVPVACYGGITELYQPKYASPVFKMQVACDAMGRIVFISGPHPGSRSDSTLWKRWGPKSFCGQEVGLADGAYSGNYRLIAPYRKPAGRPFPPGFQRYTQGCAMSLELGLFSS